MEREIKRIGCQIDSLDTTDFAVDPTGWFQKQTNVGDGSWFLAHADDGVVWGQLRNGQLILSSAIFPQVSPPFRTITFQQARLFGEHAEVRVWREGNSFSACCVQDCNDEKAEAFDEEYLLWGTQVEESKDNFALVADGRQGLRHAVPLAIRTGTSTSKSHKHLLRLRLRHYLAYNDEGQIYITFSRLVTLRHQTGAERNESKT